MTMTSCSWIYTSISPEILTDCNTRMNVQLESIKTWHADGRNSRSLIEDCVRLKVITDAIEFQLSETEHRIISFKVGFNE